VRRRESRGGGMCGGGLGRGDEEGRSVA
jgi:hypothetical protein